jgi:regulation of enolase protein 1 (concanavalin A-like superfamily)
MIRFRSALLLFLAACVVVAAPAPKTKPFETGWDKPVDPDGDCKFLRDNDGFTIEVPAKDHWLAIEAGRMNAPRLLRDVEGDFIVEVRVRGEFHPSVESAHEQAAFVWAGLLLMKDKNTYVRFERAASWRRGNVQSYDNGELREEGRAGSGGMKVLVVALEDKDTFLRLERQGDKLLGSISQDGKEWHTVAQFEVKLPAKVKIGVAACTLQSKAFAPRFDRFQLKQKIEKKAAK